MKKFTKIIEIDVEDIVKNKWNPNHMTDRIFSQTIKHIKDLGFVGAIIVRPKDKKYEIIDGEHRWKAAKSLGAKTVPVISIELTDAQAKMATINFNNLKGEFDNLELAELLKDIRGSVGDNEVVDKLGYSEDELKQYNDLLEYDWGSLDDAPSSSGTPIDIYNVNIPDTGSMGGPPLDSHTSFNVYCTHGTKNIVESELDRIKTALGLSGNLADDKAIKIMAVRSAKLKDKIKYEE